MTNGSESRCSCNGKGAAPQRVEFRGGAVALGVRGQGYRRHVVKSGRPLSSNDESVLSESSAY
jgi:hypothetical protein